MASNLQNPAYQLFLKDLVALRKELGLTQYDVAQRLGATQSYVSKSERGERRIDAIELVLFAGALGVSPRRLIDLAKDAVERSGI